MQLTTRIGLIGAGNMAEAILRGLLGRGIVPAENILASAPRPARAIELRERWGVEVVHDNREVAARSDVLFLCVKPQILSGVLEEIATSVGGSLVISVAAGVPLSAIERILGGARVIRTMPNTAALVDAGATAIAPGSRATQADLDLAKHLFEAVGAVVLVGEEQLDAVTGLSGSGPAYFMLVLEALSDGGVKAGLSREASRLLAAQTMLGAARLALETGEHPARLREMVTSPGGTAITGLHVLEERGVRAAFISAVEAATKRAKELGEAFRIRETPPRGEAAARDVA